VPAATPDQYRRYLEEKGYSPAAEYEYTRIKLIHYTRRRGDVAGRSTGGMSHED
jgi:hypothetical protein